MAIALIQHTAFGQFFIYDDNNRVWDGSDWRGFGAAEMYLSYAAAFKARRGALIAAEQVSA